jgi:hypothetical protein
MLLSMFWVLCPSWEASIVITCWLRCISEVLWDRQFPPLLHARACERGVHFCVFSVKSHSVMWVCTRTGFQQFPELLGLVSHLVLLQNINTRCHCLNAQPKYFHCIGNQMGSILTQLLRQKFNFSHTNMIWCSLLKTGNWNKSSVVLNYLKNENVWVAKVALCC